MEDFSELIKLALELPSGYISKKTIKGKTYYYLQYFENGKKISKYIKQSELETIKKQLEKRDEVEEKLFKIESTSKRLAVLEKRSRELTGYVMSGDDIVAEYNKGQLVFLDEQKCPLLIRRTKNLSLFLSSRALDNSRINSRLLKRYLRIAHESDEMVSLYAHGASITDNYWFKPLGSRLHFKDICFDRDYYADIVLRGKIDYFSNKLFLNPQLTLIGSFEKCWKLVNKEWWIYKKGTDKEYFSELFIEQLCKFFEFDTAHYEYDDGFIRSKNFADKYNFEPMSSLMGNDDTFEHVFNLLYEMNINYAKDYLKIVFMDILVNNVDRHNENYGFLRDKKTGKIIKMAPNFDNNLALVSRESLDPNMYRSGLATLFIKFLAKNKNASNLIKEIRIKTLTKEVVEAIIKNIPVHIDEDITTPILKRFNYLIDKIKTID